MPRLTAPAPKLIPPMVDRFLLRRPFLFRKRVGREHEFQFFTCWQLSWTGWRWQGSSWEGSPPAEDFPRSTRGPPSCSWSAAWAGTSSHTPSPPPCWLGPLVPAEASICCTPPPAPRPPTHWSRLPRAGKPSRPPAPLSPATEASWRQKGQQGNKAEVKNAPFCS